jgi:hypothetical protein
MAAITTETLPVASTRTDTTRTSRPTWRNAAAIGAGAATATTLFAAVVHAAGVPLEVGGEAIPLAGFAQITFVAIVVGAVLARQFARRADRPRHTFLVTTVVLTVMTFVPDVLADAQTSTKLALMVSHVVAAAIAIPLLASHLSD